MSQITFFRSILAFSILVSTAVQARPLTTLNHAPNFALYSAGKVTRVDAQVAYPGIGQYVKNGTLQHDFRAPDCLVLNGSFLDDKDRRALSDLARHLRVSNGAGVLFNDPSAGVHVLAPRFISGTFVYFLQDLGTYVTGVRAEVTDGRTFEALIDDTFGSQHHNLTLTYSPGCALIRSPKF